jgi:predicted nucleotidyltransferase
MRPAAPAALPLFRSAVQARILARLFDPAAGDTSVTNLADQIGAPLATVAREVARLEEHGLVTSRPVGHTKLVAANWKLPFARALAELAAFAAGVPSIVGRALAALTGVEEAYLFGSWAARYAGEPGPPPNDIDLLVIARYDDYGAVAAALRPVSRDLGIEINPVLVTPARWRAKNSDPFLDKVRDRPLVPVVIERPA